MYLVSAMIGLEWLLTCSSMYIQFFKHYNPGVTKEEIDQFELFLGKSLPDDFIAFYRCVNGGAIRDGYDCVFNNGEGLCLLDDSLKLSDVKNTLLMFRECEEFFETKNYRSDALLPIFQSGQSYICIGYDKEYTDKVYWIDTTDGYYQEYNFPLIHIAPNLLEFFQALKPYC